MNDSDLDSDSNEIIYDSDSDIEIISSSYFKNNSIDALNKKNTKLKLELVKLININETLNKNLSISKNTILEMNQMISELTNKVNGLEYANKEITSKLILADEQNQVLTNENTNLIQCIKKLDEQIEELSYDKKSVGIQVNDCNMDSNWFLSKAVYFFFLLSCSGIMYNYNNVNKSK
jgi:hypothetical protein